MNKQSFVVLAMAILMSAHVFATPIVLPSGPIYVTLETAEQYSKTNDINNISNPARTGSSEGNWGIVQVTSIMVGKAQNPPGFQIDPLGPTIFANTNGGPQITGIFYGVLNNPGFPATSTGGVLDLFFWDFNIQNVSNEFFNANLFKRVAKDRYTGFTCLPNTAGCTFLARFNFTPGADVSFPNNNTIFSPLNSSLFEAYLSVDTTKHGAWTDLLNSNYFSLNPNYQTCGSPAVTCTSANDLRTDGNFTQTGAAGWDIAGTDIIGLAKDGAFRAFVVAEPNSVALIGLSLVVLFLAGVRQAARDSPAHPHVHS